jgi:hypothetical protein
LNVQADLALRQVALPFRPHCAGCQFAVKPACTAAHRELHVAQLERIVAQARRVNAAGCAAQGQRLIIGLPRHLNAAGAGGNMALVQQRAHPR